MPKWIRIIIGLIAGVLTSGASIAAIEALGHSVATGDTLFVVAIVGLGFSSFIGGFVAAWISNWANMTWVIAVVLAVLSLMNVFAFEHPIWFVPMAAICLLIGTWSARRLHKSRTA